MKLTKTKRIIIYFVILLMVSVSSSFNASYAFASVASNSINAIQNSTSEEPISNMNISDFKGQSVVYVDIKGSGSIKVKGQITFVLNRDISDMKIALSKSSDFIDYPTDLHLKNYSNHEQPTIDSNGLITLPGKLEAGEYEIDMFITVDEGVVSGDSIYIGSNAVQVVEIGAGAIDYYDADTALRFGLPSDLIQNISLSNQDGSNMCNLSKRVNTIEDKSQIIKLDFTINDYLKNVVFSLNKTSSDIIFGTAKLYKDGNLYQDKDISVTENNKNISITISLQSEASISPGDYEIKVNIIVTDNISDGEKISFDSSKPVTITDCGDNQIGKPNQYAANGEVKFVITGAAEAGARDTSVNASGYINDKYTKTASVVKSGTLQVAIYFTLINNSKVTIDVTPDDKTDLKSSGKSYFLNSEGKWQDNSVFKNDSSSTFQAGTYRVLVNVKFQNVKVGEVVNVGADILEGTKTITISKTLKVRIIKTPHLS